MSLKSQLEKIPFYNAAVLPLHLAQAAQANLKYHKPAQKLRVIAVTGTNGKTTTCFMIWKMLNEAGRKTGLLTTVGWSEDGKNLHQQLEHMTTERVGVLNARMRAIADAGAEFMVLEVTSHALSQFRTLGVPIEIAVLTNITHEHLDYHKTFANYRAAKMKLFKKAQYGVLNADDENVRYFESCFKENGGKQRKYITYGIKNGDLRAEQIEIDENGVKYACGDIRIQTQIPGKFNVYNSLAAVAVGQKIGLSDQEIQDGIFALESVEGRMTRICEGQDFGVIVDYAHQPDALLKVFESVGADSLSSRITSSASPVRNHRTLSMTPLRSSNLPSTSSKITSSDNPESFDALEFSSDTSVSADARFAHRTASASYSSAPASLNYFDDNLGVQSAGQDARISSEGDYKATRSKRRIISVHGGAGRRDHSTRRPRGEILGERSDIVIITEDDSRDEDPAEIAQDFVAGAEAKGKKLGEDLFVELDRGKAIRKALKMARTGDLVLILGKGHEKTILRADGSHDFEDIKVAQKCLREMLGGV